jgi:hypothetical protein
MGVDVHVRSDKRKSRRRFVLHYLEMVVVMLVSMAVLGGAMAGVFALLGHSNLYHYAAFRAGVMATNMTVGMAAWMRFRGHGWAATREMAAAMFLPFVLLIGPFATGWVSEGALLGGMHLLMLPLMAVAMLYRRDEYTAGHHTHRSLRRRRSASVGRTKALSGEH